MDLGTRKQFSLETSDRFCFMRFLLRETIIIDFAFGMGSNTKVRYRYGFDHV